MPDPIRGLTSEEAKRLLNKFGPNSLPEKPPPSSLSIFLSQFKNPLVYILLAAGVVTFFLGEIPEMLIIFFVVLVNSTLGFAQEQKAGKALASLKLLVRPSADVIRNGKKVKIDASDIVPGDIVELELGDKVPADGKLIYSNRLQLSEAVLTGESIPVEKKESDDVFMGTIVFAGEGKFVVEKTGAKTEMGKISVSIQTPHEDTPLTKQLKIFSSQLTVVVFILTFLVFVVGLLRGMDLVEIFKTSVALAVSSVPEGMLIAITVVLAVGMQRILTKKGLVRNLISAETLGGVTTICVDKTGTLTYGRLEVVEELGDVEKVCLQHFATTDDPIMVAARDWLKKNSTHFTQIGKNFEKDCLMIDSIPFSPQNRFYASLIEHSNRKKEIYLNGAPEHLLGWSDMDDKEKEDIHKTILSLTKEGKRVIGMAKKDVPESVTTITEEQVKENLGWVGLLVFTDPVREGVSEALRQTKEAGIETIVITGDYAETALSVMEQLEIEISADRVIKGSDLEKMSEGEISGRLKELYKAGRKGILFARTKPEQKLKVINALKKNGEVVAMMGDGVNDAPALHRGDIGIVVGDASDVAKETADLVLLDSSFETIVETIKEGRGIFDNIRKIVLYLLSDSFEEIVVVVGTLIIGLPLPITAIQILWINIISDGFPHLSLAVDPKEKGIMKKAPRKPGTNIVPSWMKLLILIVSFTGGILALILFSYYLKVSSSVNLARSVAFAALGVNSLVYVFSIRTLTEPFWRENPFKNSWLNIAVLVGLIFQILPFTTEGLRKFFGLETLTLLQWTVVFSSAGIMFFIIEFSKMFFRFELSRTKN